jgi:alpha-ketoglutarate-dependent taurine dioxygenase
MALRQLRKFVTLADLFKPIKTFDNLHLAELPQASKLKSQITKLDTLRDFPIWLREPKKYQNEIHDLAKVSGSLLRENLDSDTVESLQSCQFDFPERKMMLIKNFPFSDENDLNYAEQLLLGISNIMNMHPFTYKAEHKGRLLHHIRPTPGFENSATGLSSLTKLPPHIECTFDENRPDWQALYCLIPDNGAKTTFITTERLFQLMPLALRQEIEELGWQDLFEFSPPASHSCGEPNVGSLFYNMPDGSIGTRYSSYRTRGITPESDIVLKKLQNFVTNLDMDGVNLKAGELLVWSNHTLVHGRTSFKAKENRRRFLIRMYLEGDLSLPIFRE